LQLYLSYGELFSTIYCTSIFKDEEEWKFKLEGFMHSSLHGHTVAQVKARILEYSRRGLDLLSTQLDARNP
jgi:hypothetical protein